MLEHQCTAMKINKNCIESSVSGVNAHSQYEMLSNYFIVFLNL